MANIRKSKLKSERVGMKKMMNCGMSATILAYYSCKNMTVKFDDGTVVYGCQYSSFKEGNVFNRNLKSANNKGNDLVKKNSRVGEVRTMNCGKAVKIVDYRTANDIDLEVIENGNILHNRKYQHFKNGNISC